MLILIKSKYDVGDEVFIIGNTMKIIECTVQEVFGHFGNNGEDIQIHYVLKPHEGPEDSIDTRPEDKVFKSTLETKEYIRSGVA